MMSDTLTRTYNQWLAAEDMTSHNLPEILPHDSVNNVGSGTTSSSSTHSQLVRKQIELELKRKELELGKRDAVLTAEERLALSNACSGEGMQLPQNKRTTPRQLNTSITQNVLSPQTKIFSPSMMSRRIDTQRVNDNYSQYMPNNPFNSSQTMSKQHYVPYPGNYATQSHLHPSGFSVPSPHFTPFVNNLMTVTPGYQLLLEEAREIRYTG